MTVVPLDALPAVAAPELDEPLAPARAAQPGFGAILSRALDETSGVLQRADAAERGFARGSGSLQAMVLERAQADVVLSIATAAASRTVQGLTTILGMQL